MSEPDRQRTLRRRHKHERQAVIFGVLLAVLAAAGLLSAAIMSGTIDAPFARGFTQPKHTPTKAGAQFPCPAPDLLPVAYAKVTVNVLNSTDRAGLAATVGAELTARGFVVRATDNSPLAVPGTARIIFGTQGIAAGYTLAAQVDSPQLVWDPRADATVDLVVGDAYQSLLEPTAVVLDPAAPLTARPGCVPLAKIVKTAAPTATGTAAG
jgi:hypothetical protein